MMTLGRDIMRHLAKLQTLRTGFQNIFIIKSREAIGSFKLLLRSKTMAAIAVYKTISPDQYTFGSIKKDNGTYLLKPEARLFVQTPAVILMDDLLAEPGVTKSSIKVAITTKFGKWLQDVEKHVVSFAIENKATLFKHELPDSFITDSFTTSVTADEWSVSTHPDLSIFDHEKQLLESSLPVKGAKVSLIVYLHSVRFSKHTFHVRWTVRSVRTQKPPEYCFIEDDDDDCTLSEDLTDDQSAEDDEEVVDESPEEKETVEDVSSVEEDVSDKEEASQTEVAIATDAVQENTIVEQIAEEINNTVSEEIATADTAISMAPEISSGESVADDTNVNEDETDITEQPEQPEVAQDEEPEEEHVEEPASNEPVSADEPLATDTIKEDETETKVTEEHVVEEETTQHVEESKEGSSPVSVVILVRDE